ITCGGQATIPIVAAVTRVADVPYAERISAVASVSAGPGTRANIDEFTRATATGLEEIGGAGKGKAIIVLNPADPPILMRNTVFCALGADADPAAVAASIEAMVAEVAVYVPGYRLGGSSFNYGLSLVDELELIAAAADVLTTSRLAVLLLPGIGTKDDLARAQDLGAELVRVATHCTEADIAPQHLGLARDLGM